MVSYDMPNWLRILLFILTCVSFLPQLHLLARRRGDASGLNLIYVLLNLAAATELFTLCFLIIVDHPQPSSSFIHNPREAGDWINFANLAVIWILWHVIFIVCILRYYWREDKTGASIVLIVYVTFLMISIVPVLVDTITHVNGPSDATSDRLMTLAIYISIHVYCIVPFLTLLLLWGFIVQAREILARTPGSGTGALSLTGVALQVIVFSILAATWYPGRLTFPPSNASFMRWLTFVGFVPANHAFIALEQALVLVVAGWHRRGRQFITVHPISETEPLLGS